MPNWSEEGFNKILEAAKRGREKIVANSKEEYEQKKEAYEENPTPCKCCEKPLTYGQILNLSIYCSRSCAAKVNNKKRVSLGSKHTCLCCGTEFIAQNNRTGKFCSRKCSSDHRIQERMRLWLEGEVEISAGALRKYIKILKPHQCEICSTTKWNGKPIPLEVDHIDGNHENNVLSNLRLICPNCHAQTDTYKAKNRGKGRGFRRQRWQEGKSV